MHIIKVEYVLLNVCFHLLVVLVNIRLPVVSLENRRDSQISTEKQFRSTAQYSAGACGLGKQGKMEVRVCFPALIVQEQARSNDDVVKLPLTAVKKHRDCEHCCLSIPRGEVGRRK